MFVHTHVVRTPEWHRIRALPRREWSDATAAVDYWTSRFALRSDVRLRPIQAIALSEIHHCGGLLGPIKVGHGKTLISLLAPAVVGSVRPVLLLPAHLLQKTEIDMADLSKSWRIPTNLRPISYQALGRESMATWLMQWRPDGIFADEVHRLKNPDAAVTKRVTRFTLARWTGLALADSRACWRPRLYRRPHNDRHGFARCIVV